MSSRSWWSLLTLLILFTFGRVITTHRVFSQTLDESWHVMAGYDALTKWKLDTDLHHPPLSRLFFALPFVGTPEPPPGTGDLRGNELLLRNDRYTQNVARMRLGNLLFLGLAIVAVALWARRLFSPATGLLAAVIFASLPPVLAHGGLATTDMSLTALLTAALYVLTRFLERPAWTETLLLGVAMGAGLLTKYSFIPYFACAAALFIVVKRRLPAARLALAVLIAFFIVWGTYRFSFDTLRNVHPEGLRKAAKTLGNPRYADVPLPAPLYVLGILEVKDHNDNGHLAFLFGERSEGDRGWWYYFPIAIFFKSPIPFLLLALAGMVRMVSTRRGLEVVLAALSILGYAMTAHINIGVRHVLPLYGPLSICAALAAVELWRFKLADAALLLWLVIGPAFAHPDYLPWFNAFAGKHPERILNDSNLDWGQDVLRLVRYARRHGIGHLTVSFPGTQPLDRMGLPPITLLDAWKPLHGWVAVSELHLAMGRNHSPELRAWVEQWFPDERPFTRIGASIRLYHFD